MEDISVYKVENWSCREVSKAEDPELLYIFMGINYKS